MPAIKKKEIAQMSIEQLDTKYAELKKELMKLNMQRSSGTSPENPGMIKASRKAIARILTYKTQKLKQPRIETKKSNSNQSKKKEVSKKKQYD